MRNYEFEDKFPVDLFSVLSALFFHFFIFPLSESIRCIKVALRLLGSLMVLIFGMNKNSLNVWLYPLVGMNEIYYTISHKIRLYVLSLLKTVNKNIPAVN